MAGKTSNTDSAEAAGSRGTRKRRSLEKLRDSTGRTEERGLRAVREIAMGGLAATWNASQASVERGAALLPGWLRRLGYYALALLFVAVAAALRWALPDALSLTPFLVFYLAWVGAAAFGGLGPGLLATVASWLCVELLFDFTPGQVGFTDPASVGRLIVLLAGGLAVSLIGEKMRRARIRERRQVRKLAELAQLTNLGPLLILDSQDRIISWSDGCTRLYGFTPEQAIGRVGHELLRTQFPQPLEAIHAILHETGRWEGELIHRRSDGTNVNVASLWVLRDGTSNPAVLEIDNDITDRKRAEEALRAKQAELELILNRTPFMLTRCTRDLHYRYVSRAYAEMIGRTPDQVAGKPILEIMGEKGFETIRPHVEAVLRGQPVEYEAPVHYQGIGPRFVHVVYAPDEDEQGHVIGWIASIIDITERKQAEQALRERMKELACLYAVDRDIQEDLSIDELCRRAVEHLVPALRFPEITVPVIELNGKRFTSENYAEGLSHGLHAAIRVEGEVLGRLTVYYAQERPFILPEEQNLIDGVAEALSMWLERTRIEEALRESEEKYRGIVETTTEGIAMADANARIVFANDRWSEVFGYRLEEAGPVTLFDLVFPEDLAQMTDRWESRKRGRTESYEFRFRRKDGSAVWTLIGVAPRLDPEGKFLGTLVMVTDITQRKRAEEALRRSERQFRSTFENAAVGIAHVALDGRILQCNSRFCEIAGYYCDDILGKTCEEITFADDWQAERTQMQRLLDGRVDHYSIEKRYIRMDGSPVWVNLTRSIQRDDAGRSEYFIVLVEDISERKRAEEALHELTATLESKVAQRTVELKDRAKQLQKLTLDLSEAESRERKRLAGILHDDLQQMLAAAKFHLGLVSSRCKDDVTLQEMTGKVEELLVEAIDKSRSLSRELSPPGLARSDLRETFEWLAGQVQVKHGLTVHVDVRDQIELQSEPLKALLYKAAQEMLFNVVKHAQVREARLRLRRRRGNICLTVSDKGQGFDPQEPSSTAGFGLLNIRERVNLLGGRMKVRSAKGKGSTFLIVVPDSAQQANQIDRA